MDNTTREMLDFDGLAQAEQITGQSYKDDKETEGLGMLLHIMGSQVKANHLQSIGDSYFNMPWDESKALFESAGFEIILLEEFEGTDRGSGSPREEFLIAQRGGAILVAESFSTTRRNKASIYFNAKLKDPKDEYYFPRCSGTSVYIGEFPDHRGFAPKDMTLEEFNAESVRIGDFDAREGMLSRLADIEEHAEIILPWIECPFMSLVNYAEWRRLEKESEGNFERRYKSADEIRSDRFYRAGLDKILGVRIGERYHERRGAE